MGRESDDNLIDAIRSGNTTAALIALEQGASWEHNIITGNITWHLRNQLQDRSCIIVTNDMRVRVSECNSYYYPDVVVVCGEPQFNAGDPDSLCNPTLV